MGISSYFDLENKKPWIVEVETEENLQNNRERILNIGERNYTVWGSKKEQQLEFFLKIGCGK